jgi:hypothetical protein
VPVANYLASIPDDDFVGQPFHYQPLPHGYLLYSVGPNTIDDGGNADDIAYRVER